jgi:hypothetical protein
MQCAIDYTVSNGEPTNKNSLHYINPYTPDQLNYDHDKMFPVFGYGGIPGYSTDRKVSHCFSLNGTPDGAVFGTRGILDAYTAAFQQGLRLYGPTLFAEFLHLFVNQVE